MTVRCSAFTCSRVVRRFNSTSLITVSLSGILFGGLAILFSGLPHPWDLALPMTISTFFYGFNRPVNNNLILQQVDRNAGAASSLLTFSYFMVGAFSMWLIALDWSDKISTIGFLAAGSGGLTLGLWLVFPKLAALNARR